MWLLILAGQVVAVCLALTTFATAQLSIHINDHNMLVPMLQITLVFALIFLCVTPFMIIHLIRLRSRSNVKHPSSDTDCTHDDETTTDITDEIKTPSRWRRLILFLAILGDVEANTCVIYALHLAPSSFLSILFISAWTLPCSVFLAILLTKFRLYSFSYTKYNMIGITLILVGLITLVSSQYLSRQPSEPASQNLTSTTIGTLLAFTGPTLYAISNLLQELSLSSFSPLTTLFTYGSCGFLLSLFQLSLTSLIFPPSPSTESSSYLISVLPMLLRSYYFWTFSVAMLVVYSLTPIILSCQSGSSVVLNVSMSMANTYGILITVAQRTYVGVWVWTSCVVISCGQVVFHYCRSRK